MDNCSQHQDMYKEVIETTSTIKDMDRKMTNFINRIDKVLFGNGNPGVIARITILETREDSQQSWLKILAKAALPLIFMLIGVGITTTILGVK